MWTKIPNRLEKKRQKISGVDFLTQAVDDLE